MFFSINLLIPQHGGKFARAWIASTRGIQYVTKQDVLQCDISLFCDELVKMIMNNSNKARYRLSLTLSSRLVNGTIKIYRKQVELMLGDVIKFLSEVHAPKIPKLPKLAEVESQSTDDVPIPRVQKKRKRRINRTVLTQDVLEVSEPVQPISEQPIAVQDIMIDENERMRVTSENIVLADSITLRELAPSRPPEPENQQGEFGDFSKGLEEIAQLIPAALSLLPPEVPSQMQVALPTTPRKRLPTIILESPSKRKTVISKDRSKDIIPQVFEVAEGQVAPGTEIITTVGSIHLDEIETVKTAHPNVLNDAQPQSPRVVPSQVAAQQEEPPAEVPRRRYIANQANLHIKKQRFVDIDRPYVKSKSSLISSGFAVPELPKRVARRTTRTLVEEQQITAIPIPTVEEAHIVPELSHQLIVQAQVHEVPRISEEFHKVPEATDEMLSSRSIMPLATSTPVVSKSYEVVLAPAAQANDYQKENIIVSPTQAVPTERRQVIAKGRQRRLRDIVKNWDINFQGELTIDDVCERPINRFNVAVAFYDLLTMQKMGYVKLNNKPDSAELGTIEKGEKLLT